MYKHYEFQLKLTPSQQESVKRLFGVYRWVFNWQRGKILANLSKLKKGWNGSRRNRILTTWKSQTDDFIRLRKTPEFHFLMEFPRSYLLYARTHARELFDRIDDIDFSMPKLHKKKGEHTLPRFDLRNKWLRIKKNYSQIDLFGIKDINVHRHRIPLGEIESFLLRKKHGDKFFIQFRMLATEIKPKKTRPKSVIGVDVGLSTYATTSSGIKYENTFFNCKSATRAKRLYKIQKNKKEGSKNYKNILKKIDKCLFKRKNTKVDFLHKLSKKVAENQGYDAVCVEKLNISSMIKNNPSMRKPILDSNWPMFFRLLRRKCNSYGKFFIQADKFFASTKTCSCGTKNNNLTLSDRIWECPICKAKHDRDILAAKNLKNFGLKYLGLA